MCLDRSRRLVHLFWFAWWLSMILFHFVNNQIIEELNVCFPGFALLVWSDLLLVLQFDVVVVHFLRPFWFDMSVLVNHLRLALW